MPSLMYCPPGRFCEGGKRPERHVQDIHERSDGQQAAKFYARVPFRVFNCLEQQFLGTLAGVNSSSASRHPKHSARPACRANLPTPSALCWSKRAQVQPPADAAPCCGTCAPTRASSAFLEEERAVLAQSAFACEGDTVCRIYRRYSVSPAVGIEKPCPRGRIC